ncbi:hypothetical protein BGI40_03770 [Snodgrassella communis]|jgi:hypothetical protein|uniref:Uncharacterized protein n=1 Tax=Snodgrassella communis TaxID=2946699 RepID=A0A836MQ29_9NEIS|nr:hypothetical protein [Snodgrassella communis]KDN14135.1 hypothetical protein SALWKB29_1796 [Snodgrassella communis]PIT10759.1 hypothetical protein BGI29_01500 [Snodgrassella communis]PIT26973.1 hypothetical protein BGI39_09090 [Snodgrassella communis]PIT27575.1 hypothetical protein BGI38_05515 [Snodgrassella communis]PIT34992.1 hypothetical protein BGI40_03770 [Snodgrassella communis]
MNDELKDFEQEIYKKIIAGEELSDHELSAATCCFGVNEEVRTIVFLGNKYYAIEWVRGLTGRRGDSFGNQPYEVLKVTRTVTDCVPV